MDLTRGPQAATRMVKRQPLSDVPGLKIDVEIQGPRRVVKVTACDHTLVVEERRNTDGQDWEPEEWEVKFDGSVASKMWVTGSGLPRMACPQGRAIVQEIRAWVWKMAHAHHVNAENIMGIKDWQFPDDKVGAMVCDDKDSELEPAGAYFRYALRRAWEL